MLEFGLRRAQGIDGALSASRAAYVGGCAATSNVLAGKLFGIPVRGTHAHSWVMSFESELEAFEAYAKAMPNNCVFLVDTYDTLEGVRHAIEVGRRLRQRGHEMVGIRLDSGDLAYLSIEARKILDDAGFPKAKILASNDLDEHLIADLKQQGATIAVWGVGTRLVTAYDQPALGGVYKLSALRDAEQRLASTRSSCPSSRSRSPCPAFFRSAVTRTPQALGISFFAGEAEEGRFDAVLRDAWEGKLAPLYNHMDKLPNLQGQPPPILPRKHVRRTSGSLSEHGSRTRLSLPMLLLHDYQRAGPQE